MQLSNIVFFWARRRQSFKCWVTCSKMSRFWDSWRILLKGICIKAMFSTGCSRRIRSLWLNRSSKMRVEIWSIPCCYSLLSTKKAWIKKKLINRISIFTKARMPDQKETTIFLWRNRFNLRANNWCKIKSMRFNQICNRICSTFMARTLILMISSDFAKINRRNK